MRVRKTCPMRASSLMSLKIGHKLFVYWMLGRKLTMARLDFRSQYADEVQEFLGGVYAENEFKIVGGKEQSRTRIYGGDVGDIAQYNVSYSSPFTFLSETERDSFLILSCTAGAANFRHAGSSIDFVRGRIAPISATTESSVRSGETLAHISTHISARAVNSFGANYWGAHSISRCGLTSSRSVTSWRIIGGWWRVR